MLLYFSSSIQVPSPKFRLHTSQDKKWRLTAFAQTEWEKWINDQKDFASLPEDERNVYIQVQLNGTVRASGRGIPPWAKFLDDLAPLSSIRTTFTDGIGPSEM